MVFYDQRGHGRSGEAAPETYTLTQLGQDLETVLQVVAPRGMVVLVGHSMGGMTVLSHARQFPGQYGRRIVGAALISSAAEGVARSPLGEILKNPALEAFRFTARSAPKLMHRGRNVSRSLIGPVLRAASYSDLQVSRSLDAFSQRMMNDTPIPTMVEFLDALEAHDETAGLWTLLRIPTLIACGDHDLLTPDEYSRKMAAALPQSELVIVRGGRPPRAAGQAGGHQRRAGPAGQAGHPGPHRAGGPVAAGKIPAPWLSQSDGGTATLERVEDTFALGSRLGAQLRAGDVVVLSGPLGAGKTVLAKGIAAAMDVDGPVTSPSYVLARVHPPRRPGAPAMIHVDMYRLLDTDGADLLGELDSLDLDTDLDDAVVVVEWGEGLAERLAERHLDVRLERLSGSDVRIATWQWVCP